jgi:hypothetical protein
MAQNGTAVTVSQERLHATGSHCTCVPVDTLAWRQGLDLGLDDRHADGWLRRHSAKSRSLRCLWLWPGGTLASAWQRHAPAAGLGRWGLHGTLHACMVETGSCDRLPAAHISAPLSVQPSNSTRTFTVHLGGRWAVGLLGQGFGAAMPLVPCTCLMGRPYAPWNSSARSFVCC